MEPRPTSGQVVETWAPKLAPVSVVATETEQGFFTLPPVQTDIRQIDGSPQGVVYAPVSYILVDTSGNVWIKTTGQTVNTGWKKFTLT